MDSKKLIQWFLIGVGVFFFLIVVAAVILDILDDDSANIKEEEVRVVEKKKEPTEAEKKEAREDELKKCFSAWDGSHRKLTETIKESMNDEDSYEHIETTYGDYDTYLYVETTFKGSNAFGGIVKNNLKAKVATDGSCEVLEIVE